MANKILVKRSSTAGSTPTTTEIESGEFAINSNDGRVFIKQTQNGTDTVLAIQAQETIELAAATFDDIGGGTLIAGLSDGTLDAVGTNATITTSTSLTAGIIWDNHSTSTAYDYNNNGTDATTSATAATDITVVDDKTLLLTHAEDAGELRSVYIEKYVQPVGTGLTITAIGDAQHSTTKYKFGASSIKFDGTDDYLDVDNSSGWDALGTSDFTIDFWMNRTSTSAALNYSCILSSRTDDSNRYIFNVGGGHPWGKLWFGHKASGTWSVMASADATLTIGTWYHVALVRSSLAFKIYVDGVDVSETESAFTGALLGHDVVKVGRGRDNSMDAYVDEFRISNTARWTAGFTPPTAAYSHDSSTLLLIHSDDSNGSTTFTDSVPPLAAHWQLESFDDWSVQFEASDKTKLINKTGADAVIRARITAPTASGSGGGSSTLADLTDSTTATTDPLITSNLTVGHFWINSTSGEAYVCTDATTDENVWTNIGGGSGNVLPSAAATGGTVTTAAGYTYHTFTSSGDLVVTTAGTIEYLIVAGGGSGGFNYGAGGGAGGVLTGSLTASVATHAVVIGAGGTFNNDYYGAQGTSGGDSSVFSVTSSGGGAAGGNYSNSSYFSGLSGGSGGGSKYISGSTVGSGTTGQGNDGGVGIADYPGGGGGKGSAGGAGTSSGPGDGGSGIDYWGLAVGGGGAGGAVASGSASHGGGVSSSAGTVNTGGGGGKGASGGSGIVVVRYAS